MNVTSLTYNINSQYKGKNSVTSPKKQSAPIMFTGRDTLPKSKLFKPLNRKYAELVIWLRDNYHKKLINSKFMSWFANKTANVKDMTTHMMVVGSTLISGLYTIRTLQNDKLDHEKRKTLALNDALTWGISTIGSYAADSYLNDWWEGVTRRFVAGYIKKYTDPEYIKKFEEKQVAIEAECVAKGIEYKAPEFNPRELAEKCKANGITAENLNKNIQDAAHKVSVENYKTYVINERIKKINKKLPEGVKPKKLLEKKIEIKNIKDFNIEVLQFKPLSNKLKGMSALKSIFIFGMIYRYVVPVLVMKPANKIGAYLHKKKAEQAQQTENKK